MSGFAAFAAHAPSREVKNTDLPVPFDNIEERTGIRARRIAEGETVASMGAAVVRDLCAALNIRAHDCGGIVLSSCALDVDDQVKALSKSVGLSGDRPAIGINYACSGFVAGVAQGVQLSKETDREILVIASEKLSDMTDFGDPQTGMLFGDFAAGAVIARSGRHRILDVFTRVIDVDPDIVGLEQVHDATDIDNHQRRRTCIRMPGGKKLYRMVPDRMVDLVDEGIARVNSRIGPHSREWALSREHIARVVCHQPNGRMLKKMEESFARKLWPEPHPPIQSIIADMGNVGSACVPAGLSNFRFSRWDDMVIACPVVGAGPRFAEGKLTEGNMLIALDGNEDRSGAM